jgi:hypothetical protein
MPKRNVHNPILYCQSIQPYWKLENFLFVESLWKNEIIMVFKKIVI